MTQTRHLAAIMFADIIGFTSIMEKDETLALSLRGKMKKNWKMRLLFMGEE